MRDDRFEWDDAKARANLKKHEVSFEAAEYVFDDRGGIDEIEDREEYGEDRFIAIGMVGGRLLTVAYTERDGRIRIISARKARDVSKTATSSTTSKARKRSIRASTKRITPKAAGGMDWERFDALTEEDIVARALTDPDNRPLGEEDLERMRRRPRVYVIRRALRMTQEEFAKAYRIPVGTLRDWEQGRTEPDQANRHISG